MKCEKVRLSCKSQEGKGVNYRVDRKDYINNDFSDSYKISNAVYAEMP